MADSAYLLSTCPLLSALYHLCRERQHAALAQCGWSVWWKSTIRTGEDFGRMIHTALQATRCVMVVWSHQSIVSPWVQDEAPVGLERGVRRYVAMPSRPR